jgi:uncharacterized phiE125 gp8 family phage protein
MIGITVTAPPDPVLSAAQLRQHCRIDEQGEDGLLAEYIAAATEVVALHIGRAVGVTSYAMTLDAFPCGEIWLPYPRLVSLDALTYIDASGDPQSITPLTDLQVDSASEPARVRPLPNASWPTTQSDRLQAVTVSFTAGTSVVRPAVRQAIRFLAASWYEHRESISETAMTQLPDGLQRLVNGVRFRHQGLARFLTDS